MRVKNSRDLARCIARATQVTLNSNVRADDAQTKLCIKRRQRSPIGVCCSWQQAGSYSGRNWVRWFPKFEFDDTSERMEFQTPGTGRE